MALIDRIVQRYDNGSNDPPAAVVRRAKSLSDHEIIAWIDTTVVSAGRHSSLGARSERLEDQDAYLHEAQSDAEALLALIQELRERRGL